MRELHGRFILYAYLWHREHERVVDEFNSDDPRTSFALEDAKPLGSFSPRFMAQIAAAAAKAMRTQGLRSVPRG